jgi:alpha-L-fucosidase
MAMFSDESYRPSEYQKFEHTPPEWFTDAKLGIFIHWGAYSVAAWAEPIGELGGSDHEHSFAHNPYSEWYANTIRIEGSPAQQHHREVFGDAPYEHLLDLWQAERFDADEVLALIKHTGARYFVPTTKHHDGITLWNAPQTDGYNTVARGPRRDLIDEFAKATRRAGLKFGVYYSGGLDWHFEDLPPIETVVATEQPRANDDAYAAYAYTHVKDLIDRFQPDLLWDDIDWPDPGKVPGPHSLVSLFEHFYERAPDGVINDRWGDTHWDYRTTEYQMGRADDSGDPWENCRGIGYSFAYNQLEGEADMLSGVAAVRHFVDTVSRGGNLLLNIGLKADGTVPELQRTTLEALGDWNQANGFAIFGSKTVPATVAAPGESPWVRWTATDGRIHAIVDAVGEVGLTVNAAAVVPDSARLADGTPVEVVIGDAGVSVTLPQAGGPQVVTFDTV